MTFHRFILLIILPGLFFHNASPGSIQMEVDGVGWRMGKRYERLLGDVMDITGNPSATFDATKVEDAILVLRNELNRNGYLSPEITYTLFSDTEELGRGKWKPSVGLATLKWAEGDRLLFEITRGVRAYFDHVTFTGLKAITVKEAEAYFIPIGGFLSSKGERAYSPGRLDAGLQSLSRRLAQLGYLQADLSLNPPTIDPKGSVTVEIRIEQGPRFVWGETSIRGASPEAGNAPDGVPVSGSMFNVESLQDWIARVRRVHLIAGYPDVTVSSNQQTLANAGSSQQEINVELTVDTGLRVRLGTVQLEGLERTDESFLRHSLQLRSGDWLSRPEVQSAQFKLGQLGIFNRVQTNYIEGSGTDQEPVRNVQFVVQERQQKEFSVLFGYGSYEQVRIGAEARAINIFGRAHSAHIRLRQSMRSSAGILLYSIPRPTPWLSSGQVRFQGLLREEVSFDRKEALAAIGVERSFFNGALRTTIEYRYELLRSEGFESSVLVGDNQTTAGSLNIGMGWDTRDRVMSPRKGAALHGQVELASPSLGSEAYYQRFLVRSSYHRSFSQDRLRWHLGFEGGVLAGIGSETGELPTNKRFFPGGENSIRGYQEGEASPMDSEGNLIGAETYALGHIEAEVSLMASLAVVLFTDGLFATADIEDISSGDTLFCAGLGLRYSTPLGPLRLEYAHNLNPRTGDPDGTLHLSIGFPF